MRCNDSGKNRGGRNLIPGGVVWFDAMVRETLVAVGVGDSTWDQVVLDLPDLEECDCRARF